ncbi:MAG: isopeptide-forming domain-containing fimbrial protein [Clostridiales bacterium]|nr:isopeptide-forming domain-containing fimbrial protein [Clostridiales bacterium]
MKKVTRFFSLLLAIAMVLAMNLGTLTVSAATYSITINNASTGHTYTAYQIFTGDVSGTTLSNVEWGSDVNSTYVISVLKTAGLLANDVSYYTTAQLVADELAGLADATDIATAIADAATSTLTGSGTSADESSGSAEITGLVSGYYLVIDTEGTGTHAVTGDVYSAYIVKIAGQDVTATTKQDIPTVDKSVKDTNDTSGSVSEWQSTADYDIGDTIPYQLTATLGTSGSNFLDNYDTYKIVFNDTLSEGLTPVNTGTVGYLKIDTIYVTDAGGNKVGSYDINSSCYTATYADGSNNTTVITITLSDILSLTNTNGDNIDVEEGYHIVVEYSAVLNENAVIGSTGNPNEVYLEYSNNPNGNGEGKTTTVEAIVYTYKLTVKKTDSSGADLGNAAFDLWKKLSAGPSGTKKYLPDTVSTYDYQTASNYTESSTTETSYYFIIDGEDTIYYYDETTSTYYEVVGTSTADSSISEFTFSGLDDGTYQLHETVTPSGYNTMSPNPLEFQIVSTYNSAGTALEKVEVKDSTGSTVISGDGTNSEQFVYDTSYNLTTTIANYKGAEMPETGGMGTKIFYTLGGVLVLGAGVLLIVKRRMRNT